jgi:hypothetical protein
MHRTLKNQYSFVLLSQWSVKVAKKVKHILGGSIHISRTFLVSVSSLFYIFFILRCKKEVPWFPSRKESKVPFLCFLRLSPLRCKEVPWFPWHGNVEGRRLLIASNNFLIQLSMFCNSYICCPGWIYLEKMF